MVSPTTAGRGYADGFRESSGSDRSSIESSRAARPPVTARDPPYHHRHPSGYPAISVSHASDPVLRRRRLRRGPFVAETRETRERRSGATIFATGLAGCPVPRYFRLQTAMLSLFRQLALSAVQVFSRALLHVTAAAASAPRSVYLGWKRSSFPPRVFGIPFRVGCWTCCSSASRRAVAGLSSRRSGQRKGDSTRLSRRIRPVLDHFCTSPPPSSLGLVLRSWQQFRPRDSRSFGAPTPQTTRTARCFLLFPLPVPSLSLYLDRVTISVDERPSFQRNVSLVGRFVALLR